MEALFNILWVAVTVAFSVVWLRSLRRPARGKSPLPGIGVQLVALALLAVILLPVISLTDDLQACTTPAEVEHLARRDGQFVANHSPQNLPVALILLFARPEPARQQVAGLVADDEPAPRSVPEYSRSLANRPPPAA